MALSIETAPKIWPVGLDEAKGHLRVTGTGEDGLIFNIIRTATYWAENRLRWKLMTQTWKYFPKEWPADIIMMPYPPLASITHIKYYDSDNVQQTYTLTTDYLVDVESYPGRVEPVNGWDGVYDKVLPIEIQFVCGFTHYDLVPDPVRHAIRLRISDLYENRQGEYVITGPLSVGQNTTTAQNILDDYKLYNAVV